MYVLIFIVASLLLFATTSETASKEPSEPKSCLEPVCKAEEPEQVDYLAKLYAKAPIMKKVAQCESGDKQFYADGTVVVGKITRDIGRFQISEHYHGKTAKEMGIDIYTAQGNAKFAIHLLNTQGISAWNPSRHCWE